MGCEHLFSETVKTLDWPLQDRIQCIWQDSFVPYPQAEEVLSRFEELKSRPRTLRPQDIFLTGLPGNGKTALLRESEERNPRQDNIATTEAPKVLLKGPSGSGKSALLQECEKRNPWRKELPARSIPVLIATAPVSGGEGRLLSALLREIGYEDWESGSVDCKQKRVLSALSACGVQLVIIDDINNMLFGGIKKFEALYASRSVSNYLQIPMVFAGSEEAAQVFGDESSLTTRLEVLELPLWIENRDFCEFLWGIQATLSLKKNSHLYEREKAHLVFELSKSIDSDGRPGRLVNILKIAKTAAVIGLRDGSEQITIEHLKSAAERCAWRKTLRSRQV